MVHEPGTCDLLHQSVATMYSYMHNFAVLLKLIVLKDMYVGMHLFYCSKLTTSEDLASN